MRRWTLGDDRLTPNDHTRTQGASSTRRQLDIVAEADGDRRVRKRELVRTTSTSTSGAVESNSSKRRKTSPATFSFSDLIFNPVRAVFRLIKGDSGEELHEIDGGMSSNGGNGVQRSSGSQKNRFTFPARAEVVDLTSDSNELDDSEVEIVAEVPSASAAAFSVTKQHDHSTARQETVELSDSDGQGSSGDIVYLGTQPCFGRKEKQDEQDEVVDVHLVKEVELQEDADDVEVVAEVCHTPRDSLAASRRSIESARDQVTSMSLASPARSNSSISICIEGRSPADQASTSSPAPEDSISRQGTPHGLRFETPSPRSDPWQRRRAGISKGKTPASAHSSMGKAIARLRVDSERSNGMSSTAGSNVNLLARDYLVDMVKRMGGNAVQYPTGSEPSPLFSETLDKRKPFRCSRRALDTHEGVRRVSRALDKYGLKSSKSRKSQEREGKDGTERAIERQSSSEQPSEDGDNVVSLSGSSGVGDVRPNGASESQGSRSITPMSMQSSGVERITELLDKLNSFGQLPTPQQKYNRFVAERRELRDREIALQEEVRIRSTARFAKRELIEEQTRRKLELIGIRVPAPKPKVKDEFEPLPDEALELCDRVWNKRLPPSEEFSEGFGIKLTRKDLSTLSGLDWLNDEVINFYLQLVCQRSTEVKGLPKAYAFNTFFYANISSKGYASVKRWTRKVDIFAHDVLLVPVHLSVHWCMAVVDLAEKRIDYYDSLLGRNKKCLEDLKKYLYDECKDKKKEVFDFDGWEFNLRADIPRQMNGSDCGVFACKFAEFASRRAPIVFTQEHMPYYRQRMLYELITKKLL